MSELNSKPRKVPIVLHFVGEDRVRLKELAAKEQRSVSNLACKFIRDGMAELESKYQEQEKAA